MSQHLCGIIYLTVHTEGALALKTHLCADETVVVTIDPRTGRLSMRDTGDLAAAGRGSRFTQISDYINHNPLALPEALAHLRIQVKASRCFSISGQLLTFNVDHFGQSRAEGKLPWFTEFPTTEFQARRCVHQRVAIFPMSYVR